MLIWLFMGELSLILAGGVTLLVFWTKLPPQLPWFYSLPWGESQLVPKPWFGFGLAVLTLIALANYLIARKLDKNDRVVALVVESATLLLISIYLASFFRVLSIMI
jgi:hypothetical protein